MASTKTLPIESTRATERLLQRYYSQNDHPYRIYEEEIARQLTPASVLLDAGCGHGAEVLRRMSARVKRAVGLDLVEFENQGISPEVLLLKNDVSVLAIKSESVDVVIARSVFEHLIDPERTYAEIRRVLKPGGALVILTPNLWDYASLISLLVPNKWHGAIVRRVEGRDEKDTFPVFYRSNTRKRIQKLAHNSGLQLESVRYLGQYPCYLMFHPIAFLIGTAYEKFIGKFDVLSPLRGWILAVLRKPVEASRG